ncbi:MAG: exosortase O [Chloroflexi bacterium]|nr:exosortase O [Chloroflexota bacterium]
MLNAIIVALWLWLYRAMGDYLGVIVAREDFRTNQLVLLGIAALIVYQVRTGQWQIQFTAAPRFHPLPLSLALGGSVAYLAAERWLDINTLSAALFGIATYGLLGLWLAPASWRSGLPAALLLIGVLPFGEHIQTFVGYPMRIATADIVRQGLAFFHITSTSVDTILVLENGVAQIDLPCSGVKSLWTGALFLLAATWLERRVVNWRWLGVALTFIALLFLANVLRVAALVVSAQVLNLPMLAELLHVPLGVLGFVGACAAAFALLRYCKPLPQPLSFEERGESGRFLQSAVCHKSPYPQWHTPFLAVTILVMALAYTPRPQTGLTAQAPSWNFPPALQVQALPLKPDEIAWLTRDGAESAARFRFAWQGISGSMILAPSTTWRAHHRPERCFEVYGLTLDNSSAQLVAVDFPIRAVTLRDPKSNAHLAAAYWFQSAARTTDDYGTRIWADTAAPAERWVLVSILFDENIDPADARVNALYTALHRAVAEQLAH